MKRHSGLTLIELMVVLVVIGVLVAIALPQFAEHTSKAADKNAQSDARNLLTQTQASASSQN